MSILLEDLQEFKWRVVCKTTLSQTVLLKMRVSRYSKKLKHDEEYPNLE